ncbi:hypothetical protein TW81_06150 [Vibrio galatheae]|uniref:Sensory/regulatory protein RpfC n=1 Tax=Vibrio galatheae TaxID=579748 RepID=A0A0F4NP75_9VIBR|nr:ATP-binding protein [Vibrio galatheae]KJY83906.1 hypothetical protein TW81_06150 [Vibrio galatheae]
MITQSTYTRAIRKTLIISAALIILLLAIFFHTEHSMLESKHDLIELQKNVLSASNAMLMMRRHEKDFIVRLDQKYLSQMKQAHQELLSQIHQIDAVLERLAIKIDYNNPRALGYIEDYIDHFDQLAIVALRIHGIGEEQGLIDRFKSKVLTFERTLIEAELKQIDLLLLSTQDLMLQFFSDFEPDILPQIERNLNQIHFQMDNDDASDKLRGQFEEFRNAFYRLQSAFEELGYSHNQGHHGELRKTIHKLEADLKAVFDVLPIQINNQVAEYENIHVLASIILVASIVLILLYVIQQTSILEQRLIHAHQSEKQANRAKSLFLANMSHEIRTPLNGILGMIDILSDSRLNAMQKSYLETINSSSQTLLMLINDILDLSKIESGQLKICLHTTAIKEVIFDTVAIIAPKAEQKSLDIEIKIDNQLPNYVKADEQKLRQILMNLASNAIKFTKKGSIVFTVQFINQTDAAVIIKFSVKDTGIGIDAEKQNKIFDEFKQADEETSKEYGGTGLGLAICTKMVDLMGGRIEVNSAKGCGSEFSFELEFERDHHQMIPDFKTDVYYFSDRPNQLLLSELKRFAIKTTILETSSIGVSNAPNKAFILFDDPSHNQALKIRYPCHDLVFIRNYKIATEANDLEVSAILTHPLFGNRLKNTLRNLHPIQESQPPPSETTPKIQNGLKVLVVEDNRVNQQVVTLNLKKQSIDFDIASNGQEAVEIYQKDHSNIDLILMDCMMPVLDGFEATKAIRAFEHQQEIKQTYIIALTASVLDDDIRKCYESGMDDYFPKPFKREVLIEKLNLLRN